MKSFAWALHSAAVGASVAAQSGILYTFDHHISKDLPTSAIEITSDVASSIITRRRNLVSDRYVATTSTQDLWYINSWGGYQTPLFDADQDSRPEKLMIRIVVGSESRMSELVDTARISDFRVKNPSRDLLDDFTARKQVDGICEYDLSAVDKRGVDIIYSYFPEGASCKSRSAIKQLPQIVDLFSQTEFAKDVKQVDLEKLNTSILLLLQAMDKLSKKGNVESTVLFLPPASALSVSNKRRSAQVEEPLDLPISDADDVLSDAVTPQQSNSSQPLPRILPQCFRTEETCTNGTNSCSGHGSCYRAHANCFKCRCGTTAVTSKYGKKTTQWGGNACQKKDVSMPFAMFATFGIVMTALVTGGIGMLYSMGSQDLPSVLGSGVSGSKSQK